LLIQYALQVTERFTIWHWFRSRSVCCWLYESWYWRI